MVDPGYTHTGIAHCEGIRLAVVYSKRENGSGTETEIETPAPIQPVT